MKRFILLLIISWGTFFPQGFQPPVPGNISSDYGPRNLGGIYDWHRGIDYGSPMWTSVEAVEGGNIGEINYQPGSRGGGWYIRVNGDSAHWTYMHLFYDEANNNPISSDNRYEARMARLEDPTGQNNPEDRYIFIFWINRNNNHAEKILSLRGGWWVRARPGDPGYDPNNPYIFDQNGQRILTQGSVVDREIVGPSGASGAAVGHPHLHVGAHRDYRYDINPLYYINHPQPVYTLSILHPPAGAILYHRSNAPEAEQLNERIRVNINSTNGLDLDRGFVYFFNPGETRVFDETHRFAQILFGGPPPNRPFPLPYPQRIINDGEDYRGSFIRSGIDPQGNTPGNDDFYFIGGLSEGGLQFNTKINQAGTGTARIHSEARFSDGPKDMVIRAHSIRWNFQDYYFDTEEQVSIDNFKPYVTRVRIEQAFKQRSVVKYEAHWPQTPVSNTDLGELIIDTDDYCKVGIGLTFTIEFSEEMQITTLPTLQVQMTDGPLKNLI